MVRSHSHRETRWRLFAAIFVVFGILAITVAPTLGHADVQDAVPVETIDHVEIEITPDAVPSETIEALPTATAESVETVQYSEVSELTVEGTPRAPPATETVDLPDPTPSPFSDQSPESNDVAATSKPQPHAAEALE